MTKSRIRKTVVTKAPTSTTNITGFFHSVPGFSFTKQSLVARPRMSGSKRGLARTSLRGMRLVKSLPLLLSTSGSGICTVVAICLAPNSAVRDIAQGGHDPGEQLARMHQEMFDNRTQRKRREECQRRDQH